MDSSLATNHRLSGHGKPVFHQLWTAFLPLPLSAIKTAFSVLLISIATLVDMYRENPLGLLLILSACKSYICICICSVYSSNLDPGGIVIARGDELLRPDGPSPKGPRPKGPRAEVRFLGRRQPAPSPPARGSEGAL